MPENATLLNADFDGRRAAAARYQLRRTAARLAADCEQMLEALQDPDRQGWREAVGDALLGSRHLMGLSVQFAGMTDISHVTRQLVALGARIEEPRRRIVDAMTRLLHFVPVTADDELVLQDARAVRDAAAGLFAVARITPPVTTGERPASPAAAGPDQRRRDRVLVVDDERAVRDVLQRNLTRLGYDVILAEDGAVALDLAGRESPDLILTDINMPRLDGIALLKALKSAEQTRDIPVIVISSQDDLPSVIECVEHGAEDHISKPYEPSLLRARIRASLDRKRLRDQERDYQRRVGLLTAAAEAVEQESYVSGTLDALAAQGDALGRLARVFDRTVSGLRSREERLQRRLHQLRHEMGQATGGTTAAARVSDVSPFASGEILAARYEIVGELGQGGMGMVYRARDMELGEDVAVKVVRRDLVKGDPAIVDRLKTEILLTRRISHRNVVRVHDLGEWKGTYFITMEYVEGITVEQLIDRRGRLSVESALAIGTQLAQALVVAHEQQIMHRDIKPANLLVDHEGILKVMDFGIARRIEAADSMTRGGFVVGTPQYMAPEQAMGREVDARSDLFAVGVVLYESLAGRPPFIADSLIGLVALMADGDPVSLAELVPGVPPSLDAIVAQLLRYDPAERIGSARELVNRLADTEHGIRKEPAFMAGPIDLEIIEDVTKPD